jgi:hypothetical protein
MSPVLALNGPERVASRCLLLGVERTCRAGGQTSEFDPTQTLALGPARHTFDMLG